MGLARLLGPAALALLAPAAASAAEDAALVKFRTEIQPMLEQYCYDCHGYGSDKGGVVLDGFETSASLHDYKLWLRALKNVRAGIMPPADVDTLPPEESAKLMAWIKTDALQLDATVPDPGRVTVRRLNRTEYRNTIRDLIGVDFDTQKEFPADDTGHGFDNIADVLSISPLLLEKYLDAAQTIVSSTVPTQPRVVAETVIPASAFVTVKVDTTLPTPPAPATPPTPAATAAPSPVAASATPAAPAPQAIVAANPPGAPVVSAPAAPAAPGRGGSGGRGPAAPPPPIRPVPTKEGDALDLSYYTPAVVAYTHTVEKAGKYQVQLDLRTVERYVDNVFDLNRATFIIRIDGDKVLEQEFVREGAKEFTFTYEREWAVGAHEISLEIVPLQPEQPPIRLLRLRANTLTLRGPLAPQDWVKPKGYEKFFPQDPPAEVAARREYARTLLGEFATRAFRRPPDQATLDRMVGVAEGIFTSGGTFESGIAQAMVGVLASPRFIFREEEALPLQPGQTYAEVDEYALASRLSYFFWSSMPDAELFALAKAGQLRANLSAQVTRLMADKRGQEFVRNFTGQWLQARDIGTAPINSLEVYLRDNPHPEYQEAREKMAAIQAKPAGSRTPEDTAALARYRTVVQQFNALPKPQMSDSLRTAMRLETEMAFDYVFKEDRPLTELLKADYTFLNEELAKHYGIVGVTGPEMRKVTLAPDSPRGGVLTQGTVLAVTSNPSRTSPVKRGVFMLEAILGTPAPPPPPNIPPLEAAASPEELAKLNLRETMALHAKNTMCASCHSRMDPLGLALENFNAMGQFRTSEFSHPVEPAGQLVTGEAFDDIRGLKEALVTTRRRDFLYCISEKILTYALGRGVEYYDVTTLDQLVAQLEATDARPSTLITGIVNSAPFQQRRAAPAAHDSTSTHHRVVQAP